MAQFVRRKIEKDNPEYVGEVLKSLLEIPEYKEAAKMGFGPMLFTGVEDNRVGKIAFTEITGGTDGSPKIYEKMAAAGIGTVISMHQTEEHRKEAEKAHINVVIARPYFFRLNRNEFIFWMSWKKRNQNIANFRPDRYSRNKRRKK